MSLIWLFWEADASNKKNKSMSEVLVMSVVWTSNCLSSVNVTDGLNPTFAWDACEDVQESTSIPSLLDASTLLAN